MKLALLGRQALMGVMAVALVAGMSVKTFAENLLNKVKERTLLVGLEGTYPPFSFQDDGKLTGFEVEFAKNWRNISA
jgi:cystine transport system substrate-binding protein